MTTPRHLALLMDTLNGGGVQRSFLTLAREFAARGHRVDLVVCSPRGDMLESVPASVRIVPLAASSRIVARALMLRAARDYRSALVPWILAPKSTSRVRQLPALARYLRREEPDALLSANIVLNLTALWAKVLARSATRIVVSEHSNMSAKIEARKRTYQRTYPQLMRHAYSSAGAIVAVSKGVAEDIAQLTCLPRGRISTIYNPIEVDEIPLRAEEPVAHPWFAQGEPPVVLAAGRLADEKGFPTLVKAFARVRRLRPARLVILGEGRERKQLQDLARALDVDVDVDLSGWVANPYAYMARASVFVLSSIREGLSNVLIEALASGCPVVSTDCPYGPTEILDGGKYGRLVPVGDETSLARAIRAALDVGTDRERLKARASAFSVKEAVEQYLDLLEPCLATADG